MSEILQPVGTYFCDFPSRVPSQIDANVHLNVDESMALHDDADYAASSGITQGFAILLAQTVHTGTLESIAINVRYDGDAYDYVPALGFSVTLDGVVLCPSKVYRVLTDAGFEAHTITWTASEFTSALTGTQWNAASERVLWLITYDGGTVTDIPPDYQES